MKKPITTLILVLVFVALIVISTVEFIALHSQAPRTVSSAPMIPAGSSAEIETASTTENSTSTSSSTAGWKQYIDVANGFSLNYPQDFALGKSKAGVTLSAPIHDYFHTIIVDEAVVTLTPPAKACPTYKGEIFSATSSISSQGGTFDKAAWTLKSGDQLDQGVDYRIVSDGLCYSIHVEVDGSDGAGAYFSNQAMIDRTDAQNAQDYKAFSAIADAIVGTFQFIH